MHCGSQDDKIFLCRSGCHSLRDAGEPMIFSTSTKYAIRGLAQLARVPWGTRLPVKVWVKPTDLPPFFMIKIFQKVARARPDILTARQRLGFALSKAPEEISVMDIVQAIDGRHWPDRCVMGSRACKNRGRCPMHKSYDPVRRHLNAWMRATTLAKLAGQDSKQGQA